jgi:thiamine pyrophosphate-dependent acetolactate synthase large subunit-like protein
MIVGFEAIARAVTDAGVSTVHGVMGDGNLHFINSFVHDCGGRYIAARHEGGAVNMADGAARVGGPDGLGVATVTHGPGLTNAVTALTAAARNGTPMLVVAGDLPRAAVRHNQRINQAAVVAPTGAGYVSAVVSAGAERQVAAALRMAMFERRPVVLDVANDVQREQWAGPVPVAPLRALLRDACRQRTRPDPMAVADAAEVLARAQRPVILAGRGAVRSGAARGLEALAERSGALLATTLLAKDLFAGSPYNVGVAGIFGSNLSTSLLGEADCVVAFGTSLHTWTTTMGRLFPAATLIQVDSDASALADFTVADHLVLGDAGEVADALSAAMPSRAAETGFRTPEVGQRLAARQPADDVEGGARTGRLDPRLALIELNRLLPRERMVFSDGGHFFSYPGAYLDVPEPESFVLAANFGAIGLSLGTAIGAALARPDRVCVAVAGDGGLLMSIADLETAVRYHVPMLVLVLNDAAYGAEVHSLRSQGLPVDTAQFPDTDFARLAEGFGAQGLTVAEVTDLAAVARAAANLTGPLVVDIKIDPDLVANWYHTAKLGPPRGATVPSAT